MPKKKKQPNKTQRREARLRKARQWVPTYTGTHLARAYRKKFGVDPACAIRDLEEIGAVTPEEAAVLREKDDIRQEQLRRERENKQEQELRLVLEQYPEIDDLYLEMGLPLPQVEREEKPWRAGKNHEWVGGQLLQTNKKWSHLKERQKMWIRDVTAEEHVAYVTEHGKLPMKKQKEAVLDAVHDRINERGIWIPYGEFKTNVGKMIDRLNHKHPLFVPPEPKAPAKPKPTRYGYEDFPEEAQAYMREILSKFIQSYVSQTGKAPPNRIRDSDIKQLLRSFNSKRWKKFGMMLQSSAALEAVYDELRRELLTAWQAEKE